MNGTNKNNWKRLYRFARATRAINPNLARDVLKGAIRPHAALNELIVSQGF